MKSGNDDVSEEHKYNKNKSYGFYDTSVPETVYPQSVTFVTHQFLKLSIHKAPLL
jgi:hypothetical protein